MQVSRSILVFYITLALFWPVGARASAVPQLDGALLERTARERVSRVEELSWLREKGKALGVRIWLFGGTAASFLHYVKWDLARERGAVGFAPERFDYDFTSIYRASQDIDLVVEGDAAAATRLEAELREHFPYFQGSKSAWELRLLGGTGTDDSLLGVEFQSQHTDSQSVGLVEVTESNERTVRDARHFWTSPAPFLEDAAAGRIHYLFTDSHDKTKRFLDGNNPPLFSVVRLLIKAFQLGLDIPEADLAKIKDVVAAFDPGKDLRTPYARSWLEKNGRKLVLSTLDLERSFRVLTEVGLKAKLIVLEQPGEVGSLAWWLSREPLPRLPVGRGTGQTAEALGLCVVTHDTSTFSAFESITAHPGGRPNLFSSREGAAGENAMSGNGFYTSNGRIGARDTGYGIRFTVDPAAREGSDFEIIGSHVLFKNAAVLTVLPEGYFGNGRDAAAALLSRNLNRSDLGVLHRLKRRITAQWSRLSPPDRASLLSDIEGTIRYCSNDRDQAWRLKFLVDLWLDLPHGAEGELAILETIVLGEGFLHGDADRLTVETYRRVKARLAERWASWDVAARASVADLIEEKMRSAITSRESGYAYGSLDFLSDLWMSLPESQAKLSFLEWLYEQDTLPLDRLLVDYMPGSPWEKNEGARNLALLTLTRLSARTASHARDLNWNYSRQIFFASLSRSPWGRALVAEANGLAGGGLDPLAYLDLEKRTVPRLWRNADARGIQLLLDLAMIAPHDEITSLAILKALSQIPSAADSSAVQALVASWVRPQLTTGAPARLALAVTEILLTNPEWVRSPGSAHLIEAIIAASENVLSGEFVRKAHDVLAKLMETVPEWKLHAKFEVWRTALPVRNDKVRKTILDRGLRLAHCPEELSTLGTQAS